MDGLLGVVNWATNTLEGVAFIEILILVGMGIMYRKMGKVEKRLDDHEKGCNKRHEEDAKWRGKVDTKLEILIKDSHRHD